MVAVLWGDHQKDASAAGVRVNPMRRMFIPVGRTEMSQTGGAQQFSARRQSSVCGGILHGAVDERCIRIQTVVRARSLVSWPIDRYTCEVCGSAATVCK